jgi:hypothetical protein
VPLDAPLAGGRQGRVRARELPCLPPAAAFHRRFAGAAAGLGRGTGLQRARFAA